MISRYLSSRQSSFILSALALVVVLAPSAMAQNSPETTHLVVPHGFAISPLGATLAPEDSPAPPSSISPVRPDGVPSVTSLATETNYVYREPSDIERADANPMHQGIRVHGHWTIDVKNADGTPAQHHEFENQLQYDGTQYLTALISGYAVAGDYAIYFTNATATPTGSASTNVVCPAPSSTTTSTFPYCSIVQNINSQPGIFHCLHYVCVSGLTLTPTFGSGTGLPNVQLAGSITAPQAGAIVNVYVGMNGCNISATTTPPTPTSAATITAAACQSQIVGSYAGTMSGTTITPVTVVAGQIIQITVTYTFS